MKKILLSRSLKAAIEQEKGFLSREYIKIFLASSGEELFNLHKKEHVDLIVSDLDMPKVYGDKVCSLIRKDDSLKKVSIIIVCNNKKADIARCQACGANAFMTKPVNPVELVRKIIKLLHVAERISLRIILNVGMKVKSRYRFFYANSENISSKGILFETYEVLTEGENITCSFFIGNNHVTTNGKVVRAIEGAQGNHYGAQFVNLSPLTKARIEEFVERFMEKK
jgi:CheY-like chemotaxis protein